MLMVFMWQLDIYNYAVFSCDHFFDYSEISYHFGNPTIIPVPFAAYLMEIPTHGHLHFIQNVFHQSSHQIKKNITSLLASDFSGDL